MSEIFLDIRTSDALVKNYAIYTSVFKINVNVHNFCTKKLQ
jgi:hypothetical protein